MLYYDFHTSMFSTTDTKEHYVFLSVLRSYDALLYNYLSCDVIVISDHANDSIIASLKARYSTMITLPSMLGRPSRPGRPCKPRRPRLIAIALILAEAFAS